MSEDQIIVIPIQLRPDVVVRIHIPANITKREAERIGKVVKSFVGLAAIPSPP